MILEPGGERPARDLRQPITAHVFAHWSVYGLPGLEEWADLRVKRALMEAMRRNRRADDEGCRP